VAAKTIQPESGGHILMKIAIVGGGFTGLAAAKKMLEAGHDITIIEKQPRLGGVASSINYEGTKLEIFYHHIFTSDKDIIALIKELGLQQELQWLESKMGFFVDGQIYEFGTPKSLLTFKPLPLVDKIKFGLSVLKLQSINDWRPLESITAKEWLLKYAGARAFSICWEPLLRAKFGEMYDKISMAWFWGKIKLRGSTRSEAKTKEMLGYMKGSFERLGEKLIEHLTNKGVLFKLNSNVVDISSTQQQARITYKDQEEEIYDRVLLTVPLPLVPTLVSGLPADYVSNISQIQYTAVICSILKLKRAFSDIYWLNMGDPTIPFGGLIEHTNMVKDPAYNGKHILYISNYTFVNDPLYTADSATIMQEYMKHLKKINPDFSEDMIEEVQHFKSAYAQPIILCNYSSIKPDFETPLESIYIANMTHIYPEDRGMNYAIQTGYQVAEKILGGV
jgi:protoporphyrinogen oxidase